MSTSVIVLIVFLVIFCILALGFGSIFIIKRWLLNYSYKLKHKYNLLVINPSDYSIRSIEVLVNNNEDLSPLLSFLNQYSNNFKNQVVKLNQDIKIATQYFSSYQFVTSYKALKEIDKNIQTLVAEQKKIVDFSLNTNSYTDYCSNISIEIFSTIDAFKDFLTTSKLDVYYPDVVQLSELKSKINQTNLNINEQLNYINPQEMHHILLRQIINLRKWNDLVKQIFDNEKYFSIYNLFIEKINHKVNDYPLIDKLDKKLVLQAKDILENNESVKKQYKALISQSMFSQSKVLIIDYLKRLEQLNETLGLNQRVTDLYSEYKQRFKESANEFYQILEENNLSDVYKDIWDKYAVNNSIKQALEKLIELINLINDKLQVFSNQTKTNIDDEDLMQMIEIFDLIIKFKNDNHQLFELLKEVNNKYVHYTYQLSELKVKLFYLSQLIKHLAKNDSSESEKYHKLQSLFEQNEQHYNKLKHNPNFNQYDDLDNFICEVNNVIDSIVCYIRDNLYIHEISQRFKLYFNQYVNEYNLKESMQIDQLIQTNQYEKAIDLMLSLIVQYEQNKKLNNKGGNDAIS